MSESGPVAIDKPKRNASVDSRLEAEFSEIWPKFWIRTGRGAAKAAWSKARKKAPRDAIEAAIVAQGPGILALAKSRGSTPVHPSTWLNQERWEDDVGALALAESPPRRTGSKHEQAMAIFDERMAMVFNAEQRHS